MRAFYWGDDELIDLPNFQVDDIKVRWYKWVGRGMTINKEIEKEEWFDLIDQCIESLKK